MPQLLLIWFTVAAAVFAQDPRREIAEARIEERSLLDQLNDLDRQLHEVSQEAEALRDREQELELERRTHEDRLAAARTTLDAERDVVAGRINALYRLQRRGLARLVFGAEDPAELRRRAAYLESIIESDLDRIRNFGSTLQEARKAMEQVDGARASAQALRAELTLKETELREQRARRYQMLEGIRTRKELALRAMSQQASMSRELGSFLGSTGGPAASPTETNFRKQYGRLPWPTTGTVIRRYGTRVDPSTGQAITSHGIDIEAQYGTPFRAVFPGVIELVDFVPGYGQTVAVSHGPYTTVYGHANGVNVRRGQRVLAGDVLGQVGNTGLTSSQDSQLTFEIRYEGSPQDPMLWLTPR